MGSAIIYKYFYVLMKVPKQLCLEENKLISAIKDIWYAVTSPEKYRDFMNYKRRTIVLYVFVLTLITGFVNFGVPAIRFIGAGGFETILQEEIPDFSASTEGGFWIEEPIEIDEYNFLIKADSSVIREDITDLDGQFASYDYVVIVDKEQIYLSVPGMQEIIARFDELPGFELTKATVMEYIPMMNLCAAWMFVLALLIDFGYYFIMAAIISWLSGVIASFMRVKLGNMRLFKMSIYAWTFSYILLFLQTMTGKIVPNYNLFGYIITLGYMYFAIKDYKEYGMEELPPEEFGGREDNL